MRCVCTKSSRAESPRLIPGRGGCRFCRNGDLTPPLSPWERGAGIRAPGLAHVHRTGVRSTPLRVYGVQGESVADSARNRWLTYRGSRGRNARELDFSILAYGDEFGKV